MSAFHQPQSVRRSWRFRVVRTGIALAVCYLGVVIVLALLENSMLYHPTTAAGEWWDQPDSRIQDIDLHTSRGDSIHAWWWPKEGADGAVLYCHGNAGNLSHRAQTMADWRKQLNHSVLIFDYPGFGRSAGTPDELGCYAAAGAAYDWLISTGRVPPDRVVIYGCSLGGGVAVDLASRVPHRAGASEHVYIRSRQGPGTVSMAAGALGGPQSIRQPGENTAMHTARLIAHSDNDEVVPFAHGEKLAAAANEPKCFWAMGHFGHFEDVNPGFFRRLKQFLSESAAIARD